MGYLKWNVESYRKISRCGGALECVHNNSASRRRRQKWKPVPVPILTWSSRWGAGCKVGDIALRTIIVAKSEEVEPRRSVVENVKEDRDSRRVV
jgi:hypothetical protein